MHVIDSEGNYLKEEGVSYELGNNDLNALAKLEITPTVIQKMEYNIEKIQKLKEENEVISTIANNIERIKKSKIEVKTKSKNEFIQYDGKETIQGKRIKFVEATGNIHLWKKLKG